MRTNNLVAGKTYFISYIGAYEYNHYKGTGVFTGKIEDFEGDDKNFEFELPDGDVAYFPLDSVFENE